MGNLVMVRQEMFNLPQQGIVVMRRNNLHVKRQHRLFPNQPGMNMVNVPNFGNIPPQMAF